MLMGTLPEPGGAPSEVNLPLAKHTIDTLAMLQEKTRGNLTAAETELLDGLIFDLRLKFIEANRRG